VSIESPVELHCSRESLGLTSFNAAMLVGVTLTLCVKVMPHFGVVN
jgi:hypothetical protein